MDKDTVLKILKLVEEGHLTAEQARKILEDAPGESSQEKSKTAGAQAESTLMDFLKNTASTLGAGLDSVLRGAGASMDGVNSSIRGALGLGPQVLNIKILRKEDAQVKFTVDVPLKIFVALKGVLLQQKNSPIPLPIPPIDFEAIFQALETGETGKIFSAEDHARGEILEVWVQ